MNEQEITLAPAKQSKGSCRFSLTQKTNYLTFPTCRTLYIPYTGLR